MTVQPAISRSSLLDRVELVAVVHRDAGARRARPSCSSYFSGSSVTTTILLRAFGVELARHLRHLQRAVDRLAAGHRDRVVEEDLVGDVDLGRDRLAHRQQARVVVGAVAEVGEDVLVGRERRLADPRHAFAAHLAEGHGRAVHPDRHVVAADAGDRARALGHLGAGVVRAAAAEPRRALAAPCRRAGAAVDAGCCSLASISAIAHRHARRRCRRRRRACFSRLAIALAMIAGVRSACARSSQFWLGFGWLHSPPAVVALGLVELAEHVRAARRARQS